METQCMRKISFDTVYDANMEKVYKVALYYSKDHDRAQDITQQVFMKLYINLDNINMDNVISHIRICNRKRYTNGRTNNNYNQQLY